MDVDKYIEYDFPIIIIDLLLHKEQAFRHFLFNKLDIKVKILNLLKVNIFFN
jgi:lipid intermediate transporter